VNGDLDSLHIILNCCDSSIITTESAICSIRGFNNEIFRFIFDNGIDNEDSYKYTSFFSELNLNDIFLESIKCNNIYVARILSKFHKINNIKNKDILMETPMNIAGFNKFYKIFRILHKEQFAVSQEVFDKACQDGDLEIIKTIHTMIDNTQWIKGLSLALKFNHSSSVRFIKKIIKDRNIRGDIDEACEMNDFYLVKFLHENKDIKVKCTKDAMDTAAEHGNLHIVDFLHTNRLEGCTTGAIDLAASNGHLEVVQFLWFNRSEKCTMSAMNFACVSGYISVVEFLYKKGKIECNNDILDSIAKKGHYEVLDFMIKNTAYPITDKTLKMAEKNGCDKCINLIRMARNT
jgi:ankyrin repeat protein